MVIIYLRVKDSTQILRLHFQPNAKLVGFSAVPADSVVSLSVSAISIKNYLR